MEILKWVGLALVALFVWSWLRNSGMSASAQAQMYPPGWGSGMMYAPGSAWSTTPYPYGYPWPTPPPQPSSWTFGGNIPVPQSWSPDGVPLSFNFGQASY